MPATDAASTKSIDECCPLPAGFVRLRYFFGKRLGVADFIDEQAYHAGKHRFHNLHLHGRGILCGLSLVPFGATMLKVHKGAAIDGCGHEIVVGYDQCIDLDAWFQREVERRRLEEPGTSWPAGDTLELCVNVRYVECATDPEPAPRDPCACGDAGCENGRVREQYELRLLPEADSEALPRIGPRPPAEAIAAALASPLGRCEAVSATLREGCGDMAGADWLLLGCLTATLVTEADGTRRVDSFEIRPGGEVLWSTGVLQSLVCRLVDAAEPGALAGPRIVGAAVDPDPATITLALSGEILASTLGSPFSLASLDETAGWSDITIDSVDAFPGASPSITITLDHVFMAGPVYRLVYLPDRAQPVADAAGQSLGPPGYTWTFRMVTNEAGELEAETVEGGTT